MTETDLSFPCRYECDVLDELPGDGGSRRRYFPGDGAGGRDGVVLRVRPYAGDAWIGTFAFGRFGAAGVSRVLSMPDPDQVCVVARGAGYLASAAHPERWEAIQAIPIIDVRVVPAAGLVVFADHTQMVAHGANGIVWRTKRLAWDGLRILEVTDRVLVGEYLDLREDAMQRFEVDLATGAAQGGVES